jgi:L-lactate permease
MKTTIDVIIAILPIVTLFVGFLAFRLTAFTTSFLAWIIEVLIVRFYYFQAPVKIIEGSLWGIITIWSGFLVLYTGQVFGQSYRSTGLLSVLLDSVGSLLPQQDKEAKALSLVVVIGGFIGAFNGFAVYPVAIPGLIALGFDSVQVIKAFLVYFAWPQPFVSLFIVPNISNVASHVPIPEIVRAAGFVAIPFIFVSIFGFMKLLGSNFSSGRTQFLFWSMGLSNTIALVVFTQVFAEYGILTLIAGASLSLGVLYFYGKHAKRTGLLNSSDAERITEARAASEPPLHTAAIQARAYGPLLLGVALVLLTKVPGVRGAVESLRFRVGLWGYEPISVNVFTSAGFFVLVTALICYLFSLERANPAKDFSTASRRSVRSLSTLAVGSALVYLLVDTGQIQLLARVLLGGGKATYAWLSPTMEAVGGIAFGQGLPADFLLAAMQVSVAPALGIPLAVLVGIVTVMSEGPPNPLKPTQIAYTQSLANVEGKDGEIFRACLKWQILGLAAATIAAVALVYLSQ